MVNKEDRLTSACRVFADPTRRAIIERLVHSATPLNAGQLAEPFNISLPAISKHLKYLETRGLIMRTKKGRYSLFVASRQPIEDVYWWLGELLHFWK